MSLDLQPYELDMIIRWHDRVQAEGRGIGGQMHWDLVDRLKAEKKRLTPTTDKPEPPAEVFVNVWREPLGMSIHENAERAVNSVAASRREDVNHMAVRYVRADVGDVVIPAAVPAKPEPPTEVWLDTQGHRWGGPRTFDAPGYYRYVRADVGDVVIPAAVAKALVNIYWSNYVLTPSAWSALCAVLNAIRAQQGGAA